MLENQGEIGEEAITELARAELQALPLQTATLVTRHFMFDRDYITLGRDHGLYAKECEDITLKGLSELRKRVFGDTQA